MRKPRSRLRKAAPSHEEEILYGAHAVTAALRNPARKLRRLYAAQPVRGDISALAAKRRVPLEPLAARRGANSIAHQGVMLVCAPLPQPDLAKLMRGARCLVALDQLTDGRNVGAVLRSAAYFGADGVLVPQRRSAQSSGALAKAASGALEAVPLVSVPNLAHTLHRLRAAGWHVLGLEARAEQSLSASPPKTRLVCVLGSEDKGLTSAVRQECDIVQRLGSAASAAIPSLNVSAAAAIVLHTLLAERTP